jgi:hypothetical protein
MHAIDATREGIALAEEALRDIMREDRCTRVRAARIALDGLHAWHHGVIDPEDWPAVLEAARSHLDAARTLR